MTATTYERKVLFQAAVLLATPVAIILTAGMMLMFWYVGEQNQKQNVALRGILCRAQTQTLTSEQRTPEEKIASIEAIALATSELGVDPCPTTNGG